MITTDSKHDVDDDKREDGQAFYPRWHSIPVEWLSFAMAKCGGQQQVRLEPNLKAAQARLFGWYQSITLRAANQSGM